MSESLNKRKIYPRNLTAHADAFVRGNPITTRPESGVDNSYPGLEFDQRNLDKRFFPGLEIEFHASVGGLIRRVEQKHSTQQIDITEDDIEQGVYVWRVRGNHGELRDGERFYFADMTGRPALDAWRLIHDLEPGPLTLIIGSIPGSGPKNLQPSDFERINQIISSGNNAIDRDDSGRLQLAVLFGERANYLDEEGVVNPSLYEPGDLTRSLCAPWQYDFADCGCFYWASNKPDMVAVEEDGDQFYNFQRERDPATEPPTHGPITDYDEWERDPKEFKLLNHKQMIEEWETLPMVLDEVETTVYEPEQHIQLPPEKILSRAEILHRLRYLATVEHGLMVEYLYAFYSLTVPRSRPQDGADETTVRLYNSAQTVLSVAIDEMRHMRWVNEILRELGDPPVLTRVEQFKDLDQDCRFLKHTFSLEPLTPQRLQWFIDVERPSKFVDPSEAEDTVDGLYTRILLSIEQGNEFGDIEKARLIHFIKLIVDEGYDHYSRFLAVQRSLQGLDPATYLRLSGNPQALPNNHRAKILEEVTNRAYETVLKTLLFVFVNDNTQTGESLHSARNAMFALDDVAHAIIVEGGAPLFTIPDFLKPAAPEPIEALALSIGVEDGSRTFIDQLTAGVDPIIQSLQEDGQPDQYHSLAQQMQQHYEALRTQLKAQID